MVGCTVFIHNGGERLDSRSYGSSSLSRIVVYAVFVDEISCADVVMFLSLLLRTPTEQKKRGSFFKKSPTFFEKAQTFFA